jgi:hypothetical protein
MQLISAWHGLNSMKKATDYSCLCDLAAHNYSDKSKQITNPGFLIPPGKSCNVYSALVSQAGVRKICRFCKFGPFPRASAQGYSCHSSMGLGCFLENPGFC